MMLMCSFNKQRIVICSLSTLLIGCQPVQLPNNASLTLSPADKSIAISSEYGREGVGCLQFGFPYADIPVVLALRDAQGSPIGDVPVAFYADWSEQSSGLTNVTQLMYDFNGDGVTDALTETVTEFDDGVFERKTAKYTGDIRLTLRLNLSCPYSGEIVAIAGGYHTSAEFIVHLDSEPEPLPLPEPEIEPEAEPEAEPAL